MVSEGELAPDFELYGVYRGQRDVYRLDAAVGDGNLVLLLFYPMDFSPVCTDELCSIRDADWFIESDDIEVWGISSDSLYCHRAFTDQYDLNYPLLTDGTADVAERFDVKYDWWDSHTNVPKRAVFLVDQDQLVAYAWSSDDAYVQPDFDPVQEAAETALDDDTADATVERVRRDQVASREPRFE
jgi:peroxiredoxin